MTSCIRILSGACGGIPRYRYTGTRYLYRACPENMHLINNFYYKNFITPVFERNHLAPKTASIRPHITVLSCKWRCIAGKLTMKEALNFLRASVDDQEFLRLTRTSLRIIQNILNDPESPRYRTVQAHCKVASFRC